MGETIRQLIAAACASVVFCAGAAEPKTEDECAKVAGTWIARSAAPGPYCEITYPDGGKTCERPNDCQSRLCIVRGPDQHEGYCSGYRPMFGTFWYMDRDGKAVRISVM
jgi:hypothetical protein